MGASHTYRYIKVPAKPSISETELWANSSPTANFGKNTVTLSQDMNNFTYLRFYVKALKTGTKTYSLIIPVADFIRTTSGSTVTDDFRYCLVNGGVPVRVFQYISDTSITFQRPYYKSCPDTYYRDDTSIPLNIYGFNY